MKLNLSDGSGCICINDVAGSTKSKIIMQVYSSDFEEVFGKKESAIQQSIWAFEKFTDFLKEVRSNKTLVEKLGQDKIIFFIHLLGIDTAGHSHKPHSEYVFTSLFSCYYN